MPPWCCNRTDLPRLLPDLDYDGMLDHVCNRPTLAAEPMPGVGPALSALAKVGPIYILTVRHGTWLDYAIQWIERHGLRQHVAREVSQGHRPKPEVAAELGCKVLIDDEGGNLQPAMPRMLAIHLRIGMPHPPADAGMVCTTWAQAAERALRHVGAGASHRTGKDQPAPPA